MVTSASLIDWWVLFREIVTAACGLINGDFYLWFDLWWLLPTVWLMASLACGLSDDDFYQAFDKWALPLQYFDYWASSHQWFDSGLYPDSDVISNNIIPQWRLSSVCIAMPVRLPSYLSSLVSFICYIESSKSYIHIFMYSYIHSYTYSCI